MRETSEELDQLQALLDASLSRSTAHLQSIVAERTVDGHFLHGKWYFGTARTAAKARHLAARPAASVAHLRGEDLGVFTHGTVEILNPADGDPAADWPEVLAYFKGFYGDDAFDWDREVVYYRLHPDWMTVYAPDVAKLTTA